MEKFLLFIKGFFIGSGFILPGVSGGAMAAVFGIYERLISFIADIRKDFKKNVIFFFPVGLGGLFGIYVLSIVITILFGKYETQLLWFFVGCIFGTLPALNKQVKKHGREKKHVAILVVSTVLSAVLLIIMNRSTEAVDNASLKSFPIWSWLLAGVMIGLGVVLPGLSPSNFLVLFGMYGSMSYGISKLDMAVVIPLIVGVMACVLSLSKVMKKLMEKAYAVVFHIIFGIVISSTLMIIPLDYNYLQPAALVCVVTLALGILLGKWMSDLEDKYVPQDD